MIGEFADIKYGPSTQTTGNMSGRGYERETFIEDTGLKRMIQRVDDMDKDAAATLEGVSKAHSNFVVVVKMTNSFK